jgi:predicted TIM-barrel fold metal-dependent hydrolase
MDLSSSMETVWARAKQVLLPGNIIQNGEAVPEKDCVRYRNQRRARCYHRRVIIDFHTHIFPPDVRDKREDYLKRDPTFAEMYADPKAKIATAEELLASMDYAGVNVSVALGFAWREYELCVRHNDYLLEAAAQSNGRIVAFCTVNMAADEAAVEAERCAAAGAQGLGELRPESQAWDLNGEPGARLAGLAREHGLVLLFHVTEVGGHEYAGKEGLSLGAFYRFAMEHSDMPMVGAHLAGGLPFAMPEVPQVSLTALADTAARRFLYPESAYMELIDRWGARRLLLGSDYPLVTQATQIEDVRTNLRREAERELVLGGNAARLLGLAKRG